VFGGARAGKMREGEKANHPASPRYQAGLRDDIRKGGRSIAVTEFTFSILARTNSLPTARGIDLGARISGEVESIFKELCRGLNARDFSHASQERFVNVM
jgi:hypothetical protein